MQKKYFCFVVILMIILSVMPLAYSADELVISGQASIEASRLIETSHSIDDGHLIDYDNRIDEANWWRDDENKTDRFIIKYKNSGESGRIDKSQLISMGNSAVDKENTIRLERENKLAQRLEQEGHSHQDIEITLERSGIRKKSFVGKNSDKSMYSLNISKLTESKLNGKIDTITKLDDDKIIITENDILGGKAEIIELAEYVNPDDFIQEITNSVDMENIDYIQADYRLELADFEEDSEIDAINSEENTQNTQNTNNSTPLYSIEADAQSAHGTATGNGVIVAIIDTGIDTTHADLAGNIVDGYDFVNGTNEVYDPALGMEQAHGTHITGIIRKTAPNAQIMPLKVFENGRAYTSAIIAAIEFAEVNGANVANFSFGSKDNNQALREAMSQSGLFFVCAAGNNRINVSETPIYPASFNLPNSISVTALNSDLGFSYFSNYGNNSVDIATFGREIESAFPGGGHGKMNGTSMSAGYVSGAAALVAELGAANIKDRLKGTSDKLSNLTNKVSGGNKLSLLNAVSNTRNTNIIQVTPEDDFDPTGYQRTLEENWELFSSLDNVQVQASIDYTLVLKSNGTIWAWGNNYYGALGDGSTISKDLPVQVIGLNNVKSISARAMHVVAVTRDGYVYTWGYNEAGQLGIGSYGAGTYRAIPQKINGITNAVSAVAATYHTIVVTQNGDIYTWGYGQYGQLGYASPLLGLLPQTSPKKVSGISNVVSIAGGDHTVAVTQNGDVYTWGSNSSGQLGDGTTTKKTTPQKINGISNVVSVEAIYHNVAITQNGDVYTWGNNSYGQLGDGTTVDKTTPQKVNGISGVVSVAAGEHTVAVTQNGDVYTWGNNPYGQLGDGTTVNKTTPQKISGISNVISVAAGYHTIALNSSGYVYTWGDNRYGKLGYVTPPNNPLIPNRVVNDLGEDFNAYSIYLTNQHLKLGTLNPVEITKIQSGFVWCEFDVVNTEEASAAVMVIAKLQNISTDTMRDVSLIRKTIAAKSTETVSAGFNVPSDVENYRIYTELWDNNMNLLDEIEFPKKPTLYALEFTGTQYIDTGIPANSSLKVEIDYQSTTNSMAAQRNLVGARQTPSGSNGFSIIAITGGSSNLGIGFNYHGTVGIYPSGYSIVTRHVLTKNGADNYIDGIQVASNTPDSNWQMPLNLWLGTLNQNNISAAAFIGKMYYCKIWNNGVLVRDFVPVPQGNTQYSSTPAPSNCMWDKVSEQYFVNAGTGSFGVEQLTFSR